MLNYVNETINGYTVNRVDIDHNGHSVLIAVHICGMEKKFRTTKLFVRNNQSCRKCQQGTRTPLEILFDVYKKSASQRNIIFGLHVEEFSFLINEDCFYCGRKPEKIIKGGYVNTVWHDKLYYNGIDRQNSDVGYLVGNVLPCCTQCNKSKGNLNFDEWIEMLHRIAQKRFFSW